MASPYSTKSVALDQAEHIGLDKTGDNIEAKRTAVYVWDGSNWQRMTQPASGSGGDGAILDGVTNAIKASVLDLTNSNPLTVAITDASGNQVTSFGGGTQYADGAARSTATGTLQMVDDGTNIQSALGDTSGRQIVGSETLTKRTVTANTSGDTTVYTPGSGKKIRLYFFGYSAGAGVSGVLAGLKLAGYNSGSVFDNQYLSAAGQPYARNIQGGKRYVEGSADGALTINLSTSQTVYINVELEEI